ncbi:HD domain-containing phosphohydrolase [Vibrio panuliri]|uniref:Two-component system response regulator n=1 Tax=Vibrio panuliri TaxID=1381081 RepID=A0A1Q9HJ03_9VIBR|nr:HD domain-containing phosphohydrolase [Vibrio panuliri]KAB1454160.1 response regulator [Vibrio panuliri]OLQ90304.1 two-component system response regulator [Vibrio panuliri]OLQ93624.1 two-component system response regulator [Vibrio panuliri]
MHQVNRATILAVDDTPTVIDIVKSILSDEYTVQAATKAETAFKIISKRKPDLILLDVMMPDIDGYQMCEQLKASPETQDIPVIFLTAKSQEVNETTGLALGAVDYITKPICPTILKQRIKNHLSLKSARDQLAEQNELLENKVRERTRQLSDLQDVALVAMGALAESRDPETGNHIRRTQNYVRTLATELAKLDKYQSILLPEVITAMAKSAPLHDIGKVGVVDSILLKPGPLTAEEFEEMKRHTEYGYAAICAAEGSLGYADNFLLFAKEIVYCHHEKWDGSGYPRGLSGEDIPLSARIMALADVYDALISQRVYKPAFSHEKAIAIITEGRGHHFDPVLTDVFLANAEKFREIAVAYSDIVTSNQNVIKTEKSQSSVVS